MMFLAKFINPNKIYYNYNLNSISLVKFIHSGFNSELKPRHYFFETTKVVIGISRFFYYEDKNQILLKDGQNLRLFCNAFNKAEYKKTHK